MSYLRILSWKIRKNLEYTIPTFTVFNVCRKTFLRITIIISGWEFMRYSHSSKHKSRLIGSSEQNLLWSWVSVFMDICILKNEHGHRLSLRVLRRVVLFCLLSKTVPFFYGEMTNLSAHSPQKRYPDKILSY